MSARWASASASTAASEAVMEEVIRDMAGFGVVSIYIYISRRVHLRL